MLTDKKLRELLGTGYETSDADFVAHTKEKMCRTVYLMADALARRNQYTYISSVDLQSAIDNQLGLSVATPTSKGFNPVDWFSAEWTQAINDAEPAYFKPEYRELFDRAGENPTNYRLKPDLYDSVKRILSELRSHAIAATLSHKPDSERLVEAKPFITSLDSTPGISRLAEQLDKEGVFDPASIEDACDRALRSVIVRRGQPQFRQDLIAAYVGRCAVTGCDAVAALEAAHITPYAGATTNVVSNGILLRSDIHTLFDLDLIGIDPSNCLIRISNQLLDTAYSEFDGRPLSKPDDPSDAPNKVALAWRWNRFLNGS